MLNGKYQLEVGLKALAGLLEEFRRGNIANSKSLSQRLKRHYKKLSERWEQRFPGFPEGRFPYSSCMGLLRKGRRDAYLKNIIVQLVTAHNDGNNTIVNPACVIGRHTRHLASRLPRFRVIGTDINPLFNWCYEDVVKTPDNYEFQQDDIFNPKLKVIPTAVVFFGACGSVSDAAMDYAIESNSLYLVCRTCCHQNIGGNMEITKRFTPLNCSWRLRQFMLSRIRKKKQGYYFSEKYSQDQYPRSEAIKGLSNSDEFLEISHNSADTDICRAIIDLDRYLYLVEKGYNVWYRGELFVAERD